MLCARCSKGSATRTNGLNPSAYPLVLVPSKSISPKMFALSLRCVCAGPNRCVNLFPVFLRAWVAARPVAIGVIPPTIGANQSSH
jgi:hypothetical protein